MVKSDKTWPYISLCGLFNVIILIEIIESGSISCGKEICELMAGKSFSSNWFYMEL